MSSQLIASQHQDTPTGSRASRQDIHVVSARLSIRNRLREMWRYRELWVSLVRKELKVKYKDSVLGFAWSMLNPIVTLATYYFVFQIVLGNGMPMFAIYLLSGLLVWNFFSGSLAAACGSITGNSAIIKKVSFPREILPLASVGAALFNFVLQLVVMVLALIVFQRPPSAQFLLLVPVALVVLVMLASGLSVFLAAFNVRFRDTQHLLELALQLWFWATPIVYTFGMVADKLRAHQWWSELPFLNPVTSITLVFQRAFYNQLEYKEMVGGQRVGKVIEVLPHQDILWHAWHLGVVAALSLAICYIAFVVFGRLEGNFAEEL